MHQTHPIAALIVAVLGVGGFVSLSIWLERERRKQVEEIVRRIKARGVLKIEIPGSRDTGERQ
jgi:hypothetical protein